MCQAPSQGRHVPSLSPGSRQAFPHQLPGLRLTLPSLRAARRPSADVSQRRRPLISHSLTSFPTALSPPFQQTLLLKVKTCSCPGASAQVVPSAWRAVCPLGCPPAAIYYIQLVTSSLGLSRPFHLDLQCALAPFRSNIMYGLCIYFCCLFSAIRM